MAMTLPLFMVFDVESIGLHGDGFAVGWVVIDGHGNELDSGMASCRPEDARGNEQSRQWVAEHCRFGSTGCLDPRGVRDTFWGAWQEWKAKGARLAADVAWPVEARFLAACIDDQHANEREWEGPYPLLDIASVRFARGLDPLATEPRLPSEEPAHDPLKDARQSARLFIEALTDDGTQ